MKKDILYAVQIIVVDVHLSEHKISIELIVNPEIPQETGGGGAKLFKAATDQVRTLRQLKLDNAPEYW